MKIDVLTIEEFEKLLAIELFTRDDFSRSYGKFNIGNVVFKLAWRSDMLKPTIRKLNSSLIFVGIDNFIAVINKETSEVVIKMRTQWNFLDVTDVLDKIFYVITELSVLSFDALDLSLLDEKTFPDIISDFEVSGKEIKIECMDGASYDL